MFKRTISTLLIGLTLTIFQSYAQQPNPYYKLKGNNIVQSKNYYLLTLLQGLPAVKKMLETDPDLLKLSAAKLDAVKASFSCKDISCFTTAVKFTPEEIQMVSDRLAKLYQPANALGLLIKNDLIPSGCYALNKSLSPKEQLIKAWEQDAAGVNYAISVYTEGKKPNYPDIDSISFKVSSKSYPDALLDCAEVIAKEYRDNKLFFGAVLGYALQAMEINGRHDAANFEPLATGINKAAVLKIKQTNWVKYKYTAILVLGSGPDDYTTPISSIGMLRCRMAAANYFAGMAPFVIVSGGTAHPYKTKYCEAEQMKQYLISNLHVPANAILADPHARHTTTNVRNAERIMYRYGVPFYKPYLTVSSKLHIDYVINVMGPRCIKELKYIPYKVGNRVDDNTLELYPNTDALQINPQEPLDPR